MIATVRADKLEHVGVTALETAVHDPSTMRTGWRRRIAPLPWPGPSAGAGVTTDWGTTRSRGSRRSSAGTAARAVLVMMSGSLELFAQPTARKDGLAATEVWSTDAFHLRLARGRYAEIPAEFRPYLYTGC
jgi:hypothetical protein